MRHDFPNVAKRASARSEVAVRPTNGLRSPRRGGGNQPDFKKQDNAWRHAGVTEAMLGFGKPEAGDVAAAPVCTRGLALAHKDKLGATRLAAIERAVPESGDLVFRGSR